MSTDEPPIIRRLRAYGDATALAWRGRTISYRALVERVEWWCSELERRTQRGACVALTGDYSPQSTALLLAIAATGRIAVPLTRATAAEEGALLELAEVDLHVTLDARDEWTIAAREPRRSAPLLAELRSRGEAGLVVFTSGTSGQRKAILHSFDRVIAHQRRPKPGTRVLVFLLLDHLGGINTLLGILLGGATAVSIEERSPDAVCAAIAAHRVQLLPTSPTFLNMMLMSGAHERHDLSSLERVTYGTEPMPLATLEQLAELFPRVVFKQTYGLSELSTIPVSSEDRSLRLRVGGTAGFEAQVRDGTLWVRSPAAMLGYLNHPSPFDAEGWMDTGDSVVVEGEWLRILGRKSELINVGGAKVTPSEVESTILRMDNIRDVTVRGKKSPVMGQIVVARVVLREPEDPARVQERVRAYCAERLERYKVPMLVEVAAEQQSERWKRIRRDP